MGYYDTTQNNVNPRDKVEGCRTYICISYSQILYETKRDVYQTRGGKRHGRLTYVLTSRLLIT